MPAATASGHRGQAASSAGQSDLSLAEKRGGALRKATGVRPPLTHDPRLQRPGMQGWQAQRSTWSHLPPLDSPVLALAHHAQAQTHSLPLGPSQLGRSAHCQSGSADQPAARTMKRLTAQPAVVRHSSVPLTTIWLFPRLAQLIWRRHPRRAHASDRTR